VNTGQPKFSKHDPKFVYENMCESFKFARSDIVSRVLILFVISCLFIYNLNKNEFILDFFVSLKLVNYILNFNK